MKESSPNVGGVADCCRSSSAAAPLVEDDCERSSRETDIALRPNGEHAHICTLCREASIMFHHMADHGYQSKFGISGVLKKTPSTPSDQPNIIFNSLKRRPSYSSIVTDVWESSIGYVCFVDKCLQNNPAGGALGISDSSCLHSSSSLLCYSRRREPRVDLKESTMPG